MDTVVAFLVLPDGSRRVEIIAPVDPTEQRAVIAGIAVNVRACAAVGTPLREAQVAILAGLNWRVSDLLDPTFEDKINAARDLVARGTTTKGPPVGEA